MVVSRFWRSMLGRLEGGEKQRIIKRGIQVGIFLFFYRQHDRLKVSLTAEWKTLPALDGLGFGQFFSDHMLRIYYDGKQWLSPEIGPHGPLVLSPAASVFHYAVECFEGLKAYKDKNGKIRLFRPIENMRRLKHSAERLSLPSFEPESLLNCIRQLILIDKKWVPDRSGYSLYIRPSIIGTQSSLGINKSNQALLFVIACPVGQYYKTGFQPISLYADTNNVRAWPGGSGSFKLGANYAPTIKSQVEAAGNGFNQVLWINKVDKSEPSFVSRGYSLRNGPKHESDLEMPSFENDYWITEVGTMNFFVFWLNRYGEPELITPPLNGLILPGITRDSILSLASEIDGLRVLEANLTMKTLAQAIDAGRVLEVFGSGTAAVVSPVSSISFESKIYRINNQIRNDLDAKFFSLIRKEKFDGAGPLASYFWKKLREIHYGEVEHEWSVIVE